MYIIPRPQQWYQKEGTFTLKYAPSGLKIIWELPKKSEMFHAWIAAIRCA